MSYAHIFPVSFAQQRLLFLDQLYPGTSAYNLTRAIRMVGRLDSAALTKTLDKIARRHASLRTRYIVEAGQSYQIVDEEVKLQLPILDISHLPDATRESEAQRLASEEGHKSFNLTSGPLFRALLLRLGSDDHVFVLVMHHIITDGWSMSILFDEIGKIYSELALAKAASLPTLSVQYLDFARWQREHFTAENSPPSCDVLGQQAEGPRRHPGPADGSTTSGCSKLPGSGRGIQDFESSSPER